MLGVEWDSLCEAQLWGLAAGGVLSRVNQESFSRLESRRPKEECIEILSEAWGVYEPHHAWGLKYWLENEGHSKECLDVLSGKELGEQPNCGDPEARFGFAEANREILEKYGLMAWDHGNLIQAARWSYSAGYISSDDAWDWIMSSAKTIQDNYSSWEHYGFHWRLGFEYWNDGQPLTSSFREAGAWLLMNSASPWKKLPWDEDLTYIPQ